MNVDWKNLAERAGWTAAQATVGLLITEAGGLQTWWALPLATGLSAVKTWVQDQLAKRAKPAPPKAVS